MSNKIPKRISLPYYTSKNIVEAIASGSKTRQSNSLKFIFRKTINYLLWLLAYFCPINSVRVTCHKLRGVRVGKNVYIGMGCVLDHAYPEYVILDDNVSLTGNVYIVAHSKPTEYFKGIFKSYVDPVIIRKNVFVGVNVTITAGVEIEEGCFISAGSMLFNSFKKKNTLIQGNPASEITQLK